MADASIDASGTIESHVVSASTPLSPAVLRQIANDGPLDEISNHPGAVRHHIYWHRHRNEADNTFRTPMLFVTYQTTRHGPQDEFRLCLVRRGFLIDAGTKSENDMKDVIDGLEEDIPQGHMEVVILGPKLPGPDGCEEG